MTAETHTSDTASGRMNWARIGLIAAGIAGLAAAYTFLPVQEWSDAFRGWLEDFGPIGWVVFVAVYALGTLALVPGSLLTIAGGLAFGLWAFPLVIAGATLGAGIAFLAGRYLVRDTVSARIEANATMRAIDSAIADEGWKVVGLLRLSPALPFSLQNWILGATRVNFWPYLAATFVGIMPGTLLYVWIASLGAGGGGGATKWSFFAVGIVATLAVTILIGRKARAKLAEHGLEG